MTAVADLLHPLGVGQQGAAHGANAILAVRYDATEIMPGVTEVLCYGTAVIVEPA